MNNQAFLTSQCTSVSLLTCGLSNLIWYVQLRTESWWGTFEDSNIWQSMIFAPKDEWFEVMVIWWFSNGFVWYFTTLTEAIFSLFCGLCFQIPMDRYLPTMKGKIIEIKHEMNRSRICGMSLALSVNEGPEGAISGPGPFRLELDWIKALRRINPWTHYWDHYNFATTFNELPRAIAPGLKVVVVWNLFVLV